MNAAFIIGLIAGALAVAVYHHAHTALRSTAERVERAPCRTLPGYCADCGASELTRAGQCATCGSNAIWTPGSLDLPALAPKRKHVDVIARAMARNERARAGLTTEVLQ